MSTPRPPRTTYRPTLSEDGEGRLSSQPLSYSEDKFLYGLVIHRLWDEKADRLKALKRFLA